MIPEETNKSQRLLYELCVSFVREAKRLRMMGNIDRKEYDELVKTKLEFITMCRREGWK